MMSPRGAARHAALAACILALVAGTFGIPQSEGALARPAPAVSSPNSRLLTPARGVVTSVRMYLIALSDNGKAGPRIGCGDSLVAVTRPIAATRAPLIPAYRLLLGNHSAYYGKSGLYNPLYQARVSVQRATVRNGKATVYLAGRLNLRGVCDDPRVNAQLRHTALQFPTVRIVSIYLNGIQLDKVLSGKG